MDPITRREIEQAIRQALASFGVAGDVVVRDDAIELFSVGSPAAIETKGLAAQWAQASLEIRQRTARDLAMRLTEARRKASSLRPPPPRRTASQTPILITVVVVIVVLATIGVGVGIVRRHVAASEAETASAQLAESAAVASREAQALAARVCEGTRKRVYAGASVGPSDDEGWVAELWLARHNETPIAADPKLRALVADGKLTAAADAELARIAKGSVEIVDATDARLGPGWHAAVMRLSGGYVDAYLEPSGRARLVALADRTSQAAGADMGALYAKCAHLPTHEMGAWFAGGDARTAVAALLDAMGIYAEVPMIEKQRLVKGELDALRDGATELDVDAVATIVGVQGGGVASSGGTVQITFPLGGPIRATSASRDLSRKLKLDTYSKAP